MSPVAPKRTGSPLPIIAAVIIAAGLVGASGFLFWQKDPLGWFGRSSQKIVKTTATPAAIPSNSPIAGTSPSPSPSGSPEETPLPSATPVQAPSSSDLSRDSQRKSDLSAYANAYIKAKLNDNYFYTKPPAVSVSRNDPSTNAAYSIITSEPSALGQIYYKAGGRCTANSITPGSLGTQYVALIIKLETQSGTHCIEVK